MHNKTRAHLTIDHVIIELKCDKSPYIAAILCDKSAILIFFHPFNIELFQKMIKLASRQQ